MAEKEEKKDEVKETDIKKKRRLFTQNRQHDASGTSWWNWWDEKVKN